MEGHCSTRRRKFALLVSVGMSACVAGAAPAPTISGAGKADAPASPTAPAAPGKPAAAAPVPEVKMTVLSSGAAQKIGGYNPQQAKLAKNKPASLKKAPEMKAPVYGQIPFGGKQYLVALDEPDGEDAKLYVDANGNGDLTDDEAPAWEKKQGQGANGVQVTQYAGSFQLPLGAAKPAGEAAAEKAAVAKDAAAEPAPEGEMVTLSAYRFDKNDPQRQQLKSSLMYYSDYAYEGQVVIGEKTYEALLTDMAATGQFSARGGGPKGGGNLLFLDINGDGKFTPRGEVFEAAKPFNVKGTTYAMAFPGDDGAPLKLAVSNAKVPEIPLPPNHAVGAKITPFKAKRMDGKAVNFPADYKGKVVMLDFWATWCPPCMAELPALVAAYDQHHPKGLEILGISLDQANEGPQIKKVMTDHGMKWPQVYDGRQWKAEVAQKYGINSIPAAFLVDGDTGEILATGGSLRGSNLDQTFKAALEKKAAAKTGVAAAESKPGETTAPTAEPAGEPAAEAAAAEEPPASPEVAEPKPAEKEKPAEPLPF